MAQNIKNTEKTPKWLRELEAKWDAEDDARFARMEAESNARTEAALKTAFEAGEKAKTEADAAKRTADNIQTAESLKAQIAKCAEELKANSKRYSDEHPEWAKDIYADHQAILARKEAAMGELNRMETESKVKAERRAIFLASSFGTEADFDRLWITKLRDEVLMEAAAGKSEPVNLHYDVFGGLDGMPNLRMREGEQISLKRRDIAPKPAHLRK